MKLHAKLAAADGGGFTAIASTGSVDRDGEIVAPGCFTPLPASIPIHLDHVMTVESLVGRGRPYYVGAELRVDGVFASTVKAQEARQKAADGVLDSMSIVFRGLEWQTVDGVRTCVRGELLAADLVTIPSNRDARVLAVRGWSEPVSQPRKALADAALLLARLTLTDLKAEQGPTRGLTDHRIRRVLKGL